ncbi:MAG: hypothetical protein WA989_11100 [Henriciella sp.]|uniref:hypothetical protein n=1 Tax=Henriciella sp. TaxID=1968823 RepID=UPI003C758C64
MKTLHLVSAISIAAALTACERNEPPPLPNVEGFDAETPAVSEGAPDMEETIAAFQTFADEAFDIDDGTQADFAAINAALPDLVSITWDSEAFDADTGATLFGDLTATINTDPEFGLRASEARVWGLDDGFISARMRGERLDETATAISRMELSGLEYYGVANALNQMFDAMASTMDDEMQAEFDPVVSNFEITADKFVISNLTLRPYEYSPAPDSLYEFLDVPEDEVEQVRENVGLLQQIVAVSRTIDIEKAAIFDSTINLQMNQTAMNQSIEARVGSYGYEGISGFDLDKAVIFDVEQSQAMRVKDVDGELSEAGYEDGIGYRQVETTRFITYEDIKFDKLAGFLARGEFPGLEERDLISLGQWSARDYTLKMNDGDVFKADRARFDGRGFVWLLPETLNFELEGAGLGAEALANVFIGFVPDNPEDEETAEMLANLKTAISKLDENGLSTIPFDVDASWAWDDGTGDADMNLAANSEGFGQLEFAVEFGMPDYAAVQAAAESGSIDSELEAAFEDAFYLGGLRFFEADNGGVDKLFTYASEVGKLYPQQGWGAMIGNMDAPQMRNFIATMIRAAKGQAAQELPAAADWLEAYASYYEAPGGSIEFLVQPTVRLDQAYFEENNPDDNPEKIVEDFGIKVIHTPE